MSRTKTIYGLRFRRVGRRDPSPHEEGELKRGDRKIHTALKCVRCSSEFREKESDPSRSAYAHVCVPESIDVGGRGIDLHRMGLDVHATVAEQLEAIATIFMGLAAYHREMDADRDSDKVQEALDRLLRRDRQENAA